MDFVGALQSHLTMFSLSGSYLKHIAKDRADKSPVTAYIAIHFSRVSLSIGATNKTSRVMHY